LRLAGGYLVAGSTTPSRDEAASRLCLSCYRLALHFLRSPPALTFALGWLGHVLPADCAVGDKAAHGSGGYAGVVPILRALRDCHPAGPG